MRIAERETMSSGFGKTSWGIGLRRAAFLSAAAALLAPAAVGRAGELEKPTAREPSAREPAARESKDRSASGSTSRAGAGRPIAGSDGPTGAIARLGVPPARTVVFTEEREAA